jgi:hypothetical protein
MAKDVDTKLRNLFLTKNVESNEKELETTE